MFPYHKHNFLCIKLVSYNKLKFSKFLSILIPLSVLSDDLCSPQMTTVSMTDFPSCSQLKSKTILKYTEMFVFKEKIENYELFPQKVIFHSFI